MPFEFKIPLLQKIFLFSCTKYGRPEELAQVCAIFHETVFDYNTFFYVVENIAKSRGKGSESQAISELERVFSEMCLGGATSTLRQFLDSTKRQEDDKNGIKVRNFLLQQLPHGLLRLDPHPSLHFAVSRRHLATTKIIVEYLEKEKCFEQALMQRAGELDGNPLALAVLGCYRQYEEIAEDGLGEYSSSTDVAAFLLTKVDEHEGLFDKLVFSKEKMDNAEDNSEDEAIPQPNLLHDVIGLSSSAVMCANYLGHLDLLLDYLDKKGFLQNALESQLQGGFVPTLLHAATRTKPEVCHRLIEAARKFDDGNCLRRILEVKNDSLYTPLMVATVNFHGDAAPIVKMLIANLHSESDFGRHLNMVDRRRDHSCESLIGRNGDLDEMYEQIENGDLDKVYSDCKFWYKINWLEKNNKKD